MTPLRVVHVISGLWTGGAETMLAKLTAAMDSGRFEHAVVSLAGRGPVTTRIEARGIPVHSCQIRRGIPDPASILALIRVVRRLRPDLLHGWMYHGNLAASFAAAVLPYPVPVIWNLCDARPRHEKTTTALVDWLSARFSRRPDRIVSDSQAGAKAHQDRGYSAARWSVVPNGFDTDLFCPSGKARSDVRAELGIPANALLVGLIARYTPEKDHGNFLRAAAMLRKRLSPARFLVVGRGVDESPALREQIASLGLSGAVTVRGERPDMPRVAASLDIAVSSSCSESLPSVIGEAMSCGVPCVVTNVGDSAWLAGETGIAVPPRDPAALASACHTLLTSEAPLGLAARRRIVENFSLAAFVASYEQIYRQAISRGPGAQETARLEGAWGNGG